MSEHDLKRYIQDFIFQIESDQEVWQSKEYERGSLETLRHINDLLNGSIKVSYK